jgi:AraC family transcriptional regulator
MAQQNVEWSKVRYASPLVTTMAVRCGIRRSGPAERYHVSQTWIGFPLTGVFSVHARNEVHVIHPAIGVVFPRGIEYRMSHPTDDGDSGLALGFAPDVVDEVLGETVERVRVTRLDLRLRYAVGVLMNAIDRGEQRLAIDETALALLRDLAAGVASAPARAAAMRARGRVDRVRELLAERPEVRWTLEDLARTVGYSPFYLAHQFRAHVGTSVHEYLAVVRAAAALRRIEAGEASLAAVAADLGFSHHSHLTATLRRRLGVTPRMIRVSRRGVPLSVRRSPHERELHRSLEGAGPADAALQKG